MVEALQAEMLLKRKLKAEGIETENECVAEELQ